MGKLDLKSKMPTLDDLFSTQEERNIESQTTGRVREIPIDEIDDFPNHPFHVRDDEDMTHLVESIQERGILTPALVREKEDGRYELISGHRRKRACQLAGLTTLKTEVVELDHNEAVIVMVESNFQRTTILPSEKAFAYKMKLEAMKCQGKRTDLTSVPMEQKLKNATSLGILSDSSNESKSQIQRYIRLTELASPLLQLVDEGKIAFRPAVELSYLAKEEQDDLLLLSEELVATPSLSQAQKMKTFSAEGKLTSEVIESILTEEKPNQVERLKIPTKRIAKYMNHIPVAKQEDFVCKAVEHYYRHLQRISKER